MPTPKPRPSFAREFGDRVRNRRTDLEFTQEALAQAISRDRTYISIIERGDGNPTLANIVRFAAALGLDPADLVHGLHLD